MSERPPRPKVSETRKAEQETPIRRINLIESKIKSPIESPNEELTQNLAETRRAYAELNLKTTDRRIDRLGTVLEKTEKDKRRGKERLSYHGNTPEEATAELQEIALSENAYRDALNNWRTSEFTRLETENQLTPIERRERIEHITLAGTVEEADRLYNLKMELRAEQRAEKERFPIITNNTISN